VDDVKWMIARQIPQLRRFALALTGSRDRADDLVQDCLERALRKRHLWTRRGSIRNWLLRLLQRSHIDQHRRRPRFEVEATTEVIDGAIAHPPDQERRAECRTIVEALDRLPEEQRAVILLVALEGCNYDEAAEILAVPIGTVRSRLSRGRQSLRELRAAPPERPALRRVK
jgi:RNA polymerase sigma-70 factor (ECF subfamily)